MPLVELCKHLEVSEETYCRWRNQYGVVKVDDAKRLKELEKRNARLQRLVDDQAFAGKVLKVLTVTDEFNHTALAIEVERFITREHLVRIIDRLTSVHGHAIIVHMGNGPKMTGNAITDWLRFGTTGSTFFEPGAC